MRLSRSKNILGRSEGCKSSNNTQFLSTDFGKFLRSPAARAGKYMGGEWRRGGAHSRNSAPFPRLSLRYFLRAKATHPAKCRMATQQRVGPSTPPRHNAISTTYFRPVAFSRFFLSDSFFSRRARSALNSPLPPIPHPAYRSYILVDNRTPEPMPFPRLRTPSRVSFRALPSPPPPSLPFPRANLPLTYVRVFR